MYPPPPSLPQKAPEVLMCRGYDQRVDIWGLGLITYLILCGQLPFQGKNRAELIGKARYYYRLRPTSQPLHHPQPLESHLVFHPTT